MLWCSWKGTSENHDGYILSNVICLNHIAIHCGSSWVTWGETLVTMRDFPINLFELEHYTVYGSSVGPAVIHIPPSLTQSCVLLVWSINRAQESLPEFVVVFCESLKRARPCLASLCALSLVFVVKGMPKLAHVCGWRELRWRLDGRLGRRGRVKGFRRAKAEEFLISAMQTYWLTDAAVSALWTILLFK